VGRPMSTFCESRPDNTGGQEGSDGGNIRVGSVTLPLFYVVTVAGLVGLWRFRRRRGAELLLIQAGYFVVASLVTIAVPRLRVPLDLAAAIGAGLLVAELIARRAGEQVARADERPRPPPPAPASTRRARVLVALAVVAALVVAAAGVAFARTRVEDNARTQLEEKIARDGPAVQRLAGVDADELVRDGPAPTPADYQRAQTLADRLSLLS